MKKSKQFRPTAFILNAKMKVSLMLLLMLMLVPQGTWAIGGSGSSRFPYTIANASDLVAFANIVNGSEQGAYAKLTADITLTSAWTAMGTSSKPYTGTFDGQGHKISGLSLTATADNAGFFGYVNGATIKNFTLDGTISSNSNNVGSVAGHSKGNTQILDVVSSVNITMSAAKQHLGGIVGYLCDATGDTPVIKGCTYSGTMDVASSTDSNGGIVGYGLKNANISITNCFFSGTIKTTGSNARVGGILGYADDDGSNFVALSGCFVSGSFSTGSGTDDVGAIAGMPRGNTYKVIKNNNCLSGIATHILGNNFERDGKCDASNKAITISVTAGANGTVSHSYVNPTSTIPTQLQVVATPNEHYHFGSWSDSGAQTHSVGLTANVSLSASFAIDQHTISVVTNNANYGTVSGGGTFDYNSTKTITATPKTHYHFEQWNDGNTNASRQITVTEDKTYTATFAIDQFTITVKTNDSSMGTVSGGGTFDYGSTKTITATPKAHYHFVQWNDGDKTASRQISVTGNATYTATFEIDQHTITLKTNDSNMGTVSGGGTFNYNSTKTITATPKEHYHFVQWNDDNTNASRTITVTEDKTYTATFAIDQHTITVQANNSNYGTVSGSGTYNYGTQQTITATPNAGYYFTGWSDGNTDNPRTITVSGEATYTATFVKPKAVLDGSTLTFYYDAEVHSGRQYDLNTGENYPAWALGTQKHAEISY